MIEEEILEFAVSELSKAILELEKVGELSPETKDVLKAISGGEEVKEYE